MINLNFKALFFFGLIFLAACANDPQTLKNNGIVAVPLHPAANISKTSYLRLLATQAAKRYGINHRLFHALITQESAWTPKA